MAFSTSSCSGNILCGLNLQNITFPTFVWLEFSTSICPFENGLCAWTMQVSIPWYSCSVSAVTMREGSRYFEHIGRTFSLDKWTPTDSVLIICFRSSAFQRSVGLVCRPAPGMSVDLAYQRINTGSKDPHSLRQYHPYTSTSRVGTWDNTNFVPILYQPKISLGPINRTILVQKFWKKYPIPIPTSHAKKKPPRLPGPGWYVRCQTNTGQESKSPDSREKLCFSSILMTPLERWCCEHVAEF